MRVCYAILLLLTPLVASATLPKEKNSEVRIQKSVGNTNASSHLPPATAHPPPSTLNLPPATSAWTPTPFDRYDGILERMPFGQPPPPAAVPVAAAVPAPPPPPFVSKLVLCAINRRPNGTVEVGFVDNSQKPPRNYLMDQGATEDGYTVVSTDFEMELATLEKDGISIDLKMGTAPAVGTAKPTPAAPPLPGALQPRVTSTVATPAARPGMIQRSARPGMLPMPGIPTAQTADMKKTREELTKLKESGGDVSSYLAKLRERKANENAAKAAAEQTAREKMQELANKMTAAELAKREREINLSLIEQGARPISDIVLTADEEKALVQKGILPDAATPEQ